MTNHTRSPKSPSRFGFALASLLLLGSAPAFADDPYHHHWDHDHYHHWDHHYHGGYYVAPGVVYADPPAVYVAPRPVYAVPAPVYAYPPSLNIVIPVR